MTSQSIISFLVNHAHVVVKSKPGEMLSDLLRETLGLTGTKIGCNEAECGSCTVLVDGEPVLSCTYPAQRAHGHEVLTIEGLSGEGQPLHPLQDAFVKHGAVQCGFCIPGQILTAYSLLQKNPDPTSAEIRYALKDTLCRCAGYPTIERSIQAAAKAIRTNTAVEEPDIPQSSRPRNVIGRNQTRPEGISKVNGLALFTDDLKFPGMLYGATKRAMVPHAILLNLDVEAARKLPGVRAVLTAHDIPGEHNHGIVIPDWPIMVDLGEKVRYVGDAIAIVAADSREISLEALDLIKPEFELLPVIGDPIQAHTPGIEKLHVNGNQLKHITVRKGDLEKGFGAADVVLEHTFHTAIAEHAFLEPECSIARVTKDGRMEVYVGSQIPYQDRDQIASGLGWPVEKVHVIGMLIGGGFGGKEDITGQIHAALLAQATGKPVKVLYDRHESLLVHPKRHATQIHVKVGASRDGRLTAMKSELYGDTGAYASLGDKVMTRATTHSSGPYEIPNVWADCFAMYTNNPPAGAFRGFGVVQSAFAVESLMDMLAQELDIDPIELRRRNALQVGSITNTGQTLQDSVGLMECIERVQSEIKIRIAGNPFASREVPGKPHLRRAWGFAVGYKNTGLGGGAPDKAGADIELLEDGMVEVRTSSAELGQGLVTVLQMVAAEEMGLPIDLIKVLLSDTDLTPDGGPTTASRQTYVTGNAVRLAAQVLRQALASYLAEKYDCPPEDVHFIEGLAQINQQKIQLGQIASDMKKDGQAARARYDYWAPQTQPLGEGGNMHFAFAFAAQAAEVEVNLQTGEVRVIEVIAANDAGDVINPIGFQGQVEGGVMMGLGNALTEEYIVEQGRVFTDRLARYRIPSIMQTPEITSIIVEHPTRDGPYGAKGVGEIVTIPTTPAITNAIYNATGVRIDKLPVDQEFIAKQIRDMEVQAVQL